MIKTSPKLIIFSIFLLIFICGCSIPDMKNIKLNNDSNLYAGKGEVCENPYVKVNCQKGLECTLVTSQPYVTKVCYPKDYNPQEDFSYRTEYENNIITNNTQN